VWASGREADTNSVAQEDNELEASLGYVMRPCFKLNGHKKLRIPNEKDFCHHSRKIKINYEHIIKYINKI
jgi:hypothetical protein